MTTHESIVENALARHGWLATDESPCLAVAYADSDLPFGWMRVADDYATYAVGAAHEIAEALDEIEGNDYDELGSLPFGDAAPENSRDWPSLLLSVERLEEGDSNDSPNTLLTLATNGGIKYVAGPHGVHCCALEDWVNAGKRLAGSREDAIAFGCVDSN